MADRIRDFFSPEAGQRRRSWLNEVEGKAADAMRYYLGPDLFPPVNALASGVAMISPGADVQDAYTASGELMQPDRSLLDRAASGAALAGSLGAMFMPGGVSSIRQGIDDLADAGVRAYDPATVNAFPPIPNAPPRNLRERYAGGLDFASGGKDPQRISITPERVEAAAEYYTRGFNPGLFLNQAEADAYRSMLSAPTAQMENARAFAEEMARSGERVRFKMPDGPRGSLYVRVGDKGTVRFSDHAQPQDWVDGERQTVGGYSSALGRRHQPATASVDPQSGTTLDDVMRQFSSAGVAGAAALGAGALAMQPGQAEAQPAAVGNLLFQQEQAKRIRDYLGGVQ